MMTLINIQSQQLFTDLTSEEASVAQGGVFLFSAPVKFDYLLYSREFKNSVGSKIQTTLNTASGGKNSIYNNLYNATLQQKVGNSFVDLKTVTTPINGSKAIIWKGLSIGNTFRLKLDDNKDDELVVGSLTVWD